MYALVDCNNFFVSCERAFQPQLEGRPVVVLSNNDGCVVARSNESKAMGIKMGTPFFQIKGMVDSGRLEVRSSNYNLYGDLSSRVMGILRETFPEVHVYSIDEAFMSLDGINPAQYRPLCLGLVRRIRQWTGIPVSIGIAPTKTLGKVANHFAKRYPGYRGVCVIDNEEKMRKALSMTPIDDVWGIGWRGAPKLMAMGIKTALDFVQRPQEWVRKHMGVIGVRTWSELQGIPAVQEETETRRQTICTSRSFADMISDESELMLRISDFAGICAKKLRSEGSAACRVGVFMHTNRFREDLEQYYPFHDEVLDVPSNSTQAIVAAALEGMRRVYRPEFQYKRAGVIVSDIVPADAVQGDLFSMDLEQRDKENVLSEVMDRFNGAEKNLVRLATQRGGHYADGIRREHCSRLYSTKWSDMLEVKSS